LTKGKVIQIGLIISLLGILLYKISFFQDLNEINTGSIPNVILFSLIFIWVVSYILRVVNGKMTFMEQRKRYREKYDKIFDEKLKKKFNSMTVEEQNILLKELEEN
tara:strand:+ start:346 stop:663 length:318 start_codon:yes stop_codon:yes gene_type:complete